VAFSSPVLANPRLAVQLAWQLRRLTSDNKKQYLLFELPQLIYPARQEGVAHGNITGTGWEWGLFGQKALPTTTPTMAVTI
jgi:hypothetical protein